MKKLAILVVMVLVMANVASATSIRGIDIAFVTIGNPGNAGDTRRDANPRGAGAVDYTYDIGMYEITNGQWDAFVLAAGAPTGNPFGYRNSATTIGDYAPTNEVSWYEAAQFCNYLTSGDKSRGAYQFSGYNTDPGEFTGIDRDLAISIYGMVYVIPTEDEWYKAAYYTGSGYSTYANGQNALDYGWNYASGGVPSSPWDVDTGTEEQNGTFNMMGNVSEWNEAIITASLRGYRGGSFVSTFGSLSSHSIRVGSGPNFEHDDIGFRVASVGIVPEPTTLALLTLGGLMLKRRRA